MPTTLPEADERFWSRVIKTEMGCWVWTNKDGEPINTYGTWRGRPAHRVALFSRIPDPDTARNEAPPKRKRKPKPGQMPRYLACHHCDNPPCVNPDHLYWGSPGSNADDRTKRGPKCEETSVLYQRRCEGYGSRWTDEGMMVCGVHHYWYRRRKAERIAAGRPERAEKKEP
jgi:hypothetical protein